MALINNTLSSGTPKANLTVSGSSITQAPTYDSSGLMSLIPSPNMNLSPQVSSSTNKAPSSTGSISGLIPIANASTGTNLNAGAGAGTGTGTGTNTNLNTNSSYYSPFGTGYGNGLIAPPQNASFPGLVSNLGTLANQPSPGYLAAQKQYQTANQELADLKTAAANNQFIGAGTNMAEYAGTQGLLANRLANEENALTGEMNATLGQMGAATSQQGTQQSGLYNAGSLAAPQPGQNPASQSFNPLTEQYSNLAISGAGGNGAEALRNLGITLGAEGAGAALVPLQQALSAGKGESQNVNSYLQSNPDLNPTGSTLVNGLDQWLKNGQFGDPKYQTLANYLTAYATQMAPLLANGGSVTNMKLALQQSLINGQASGQSISQVLAQLDAEAQATYNNRASGAAGGGTISGGNSVTSVPGGTNPPGNTFPSTFFPS